MGDLACDSERVLMEGHDVSSVCKDDMVLLEEALPPAGQTLGSCAELCHNQDGTHKQARDAGFFDSEVDISGSPSSGIKRGKGGDGNSRAISNYIEPKASSTYERLPSFPVSSTFDVKASRLHYERRPREKRLRSIANRSPPRELGPRCVRPPSHLGRPHSEGPPTALQVQEEGQEQAETEAEEEEVAWQRQEERPPQRHPQPACSRRARAVFARRTRLRRSGGGRGAGLQRLRRSRAQVRRRLPTRDRLGADVFPRRRGVMRADGGPGPRHGGGVDRYGGCT